MTGETIANVKEADATAVRNAIDGAAQAFTTWRLVPAPRRGEFARLLGEELRAAKDELGRLIMIEVRKIASEGRSEAQESGGVGLECSFGACLRRYRYLEAI